MDCATADHLHADLPDQALRNALHQRRPQPGVIFHSDRGCQYTSQQYAHTARQARNPPLRRTPRIEGWYNTHRHHSSLNY